MAYRKKANIILTCQPDIVIIPECERPDKLKYNSGTPKPTDTIWYGTNPNKGLGVFSYGTYRLELLGIHNPDIKTILPISVTGGSIDFILLAIWAHNPQDPDFNYIGQVWKAIHYYENILKHKSTIIAGDFNSNVFWDKLGRKTNHTMAVDALHNLNIYSTYHRFRNLNQGSEMHPTFFMYRHQDKPYHIDYCFASVDLIYLLENVEVGEYEHWTQHSDHKPLIITFKD